MKDTYAISIDILSHQDCASLAVFEVRDNIDSLTSEARVGPKACLAPLAFPHAACLGGINRLACMGVVSHVGARDGPLEGHSSWPLASVMSGSAKGSLF